MKIITNYGFDAEHKQITFTDFVNVSLERVKLIINLTRGVVIYNSEGSSVDPVTGLTNLGTASGNILTLNYDTLTARMLSTDKLKIEYDDITETVEIVGTPVGVLNNDLIPAQSVMSMRWLSLQLTGTWSATVTIQGSNDGINYSNIVAQSVGATGTASLTSAITANGIYAAPINFKYLRIRVTAYTSGSVVGTVELFRRISGLFTGGYVVGQVLPGVTATALGKAEDAVAGSGDTGVLMLAVRNDTNAVSTNTDGDYSQISTDSSGRIKLAGYSNGRVTADGQLKSGAGFIHTVTIAPTGVITAGVVTIYDSLTESGTVLLSVYMAVGAAPVDITLDTNFATGLYIGYDATLANVQTRVSYT